MKKSLIYIIMALAVAGCNSVTLKPGTLKPGAKVHTPRGGFSMRRSIKDELETRGYRVLVGRAMRFSEDNGYEYERYAVPKDVRYVFRVTERKEKLRPVWCALNGFWWWNFSVSIADQESGTEILTWRGRGCADSSMRKLQQILDKLEESDEQ